VGWQYVGVLSDNKLIPDNDKVTVENVKEFISSNPDILMADDFSGTSLRFNYIKEYFKGKRVPQVARMLEDTKFMKFIEEKVPNIKFYKGTKPFVFHRVKEDQSLWCNQVTNTITSLMEK
jgi:hypothetical protein